MKKARPTEVRRALDALTSSLIILAKPATQQAITLLVLMTFALLEMVL